MLYEEVIAVCSEIHTNTLCWQIVELLILDFLVHIVTTVCYCLNAAGL